MLRSHHFTRPTIWFICVWLALAVLCYSTANPNVTTSHDRALRGLISLTLYIYIYIYSVRWNPWQATGTRPKWRKSRLTARRWLSVAWNTLFSSGWAHAAKSHMFYLGGVFTSRSWNYSISSNTVMLPECVLFQKHWKLMIKRHRNYSFYRLEFE